MAGLPDSLALLLFTAVAARIIYVLFVKHWNYFSDRNIPFYRGIPLLGSQYKLFLGLDSIVEVSAEKMLNDIWTENEHGKRSE